MSRVKDIGFSTVVSFISTLIVLAPAVNYVLAGEIAAHVSPLFESQRILLQAAIEDYGDTIAALEFKRDMCAGSTCWTEQDAKNLARIVSKMQASKDALKKLGP